MNAELPFMATENILMEAVKAGGDRQHLHEVIRTHSMEAARQIKSEGKENDLLERIRKDEAFALIHDRIDSMVDPINYVGRSPQQVVEYITDHVDPILTRHASTLAALDAKSASEVSI